MSTDLVRFVNAFLAPTSRALDAAGWSPPVDIYRLDDGWLLKFDLAGVRRNDIQVSIRGRQLIVRGQRRDWVVEERRSCRAYSMEITYSQFERTVELPCELEPLPMALEYRDGMLLVRLDTEGCTG
jgi:HSP20 family protein